ncbi:MAG: CRISPR-associated protein [Anaerophaga sp.]|jgi:hypothetical protein|uniref:hypothetical protein n=1 Tax=Anaerophaga thermohalophila TaxID=177400 RepID=UPI00031653CB|nr:hypothetical protein [Anaerophaga thermohalophila]MBZ4677016.1 CRISPR-associated protein [Anaerophaga sp.]
MLINLSNHPSDIWDREQKSTAEKQFGNIRDLSFPLVDPMADENEINSIANSLLNRCVEIFEDQPASPTNAVHIMGEMTLTFAVVKKLQKHHIQCIASTTQRKVSINDKDQKSSIFKFCRFRKYL